MSDIVRHATAVSLLTAVATRLQDDDVRLVFADWLEDHAEDEDDSLLVELIRYPATFCVETTGSTYSCSGKAPSPPLQHVAFRLSERLLGCWPIGPLSGDGYRRSVVFRRGFIESATCRSLVWALRGPPTVYFHPIRYLRLTDSDTVLAVSWSGKGPCVRAAREGLREALVRADPVDIDSCREGLFRAAIGWARGQARQVRADRQNTRWRNEDPNLLPRRPADTG